MAARYQYRCARPRKRCAAGQAEILGPAVAIGAGLQAEAIAIALRKMRGGRKTTGERDFSYRHGGLTQELARTLETQPREIAAGRAAEMRLEQALELALRDREMTRQCRTRERRCGPVFHQAHRIDQQ